MRIFVFLWALMFPFAAAATSPCVPQTPEQFQAVKNDSDLIAHVRVQNYYREKNPNSPENGLTFVKVLQTYKGQADSDVMTVRWASYYPPLYTYDVGNEMVLLIKKEEGKWYLTDSSWKSCVPSVIGLPKEFPIQWKGKTYSREEFIQARLNPEESTE